MATPWLGLSFLGIFGILSLSGEYFALCVTCNDIADCLIAMTNDRPLVSQNSCFLSVLTVVVEDGILFNTMVVLRQRIVYGSIRRMPLLLKRQIRWVQLATVFFYRIFLSFRSSRQNVRFSPTSWRTQSMNLSTDPNLYQSVDNN